MSHKKKRRSSKDKNTKDLRREVERLKERIKRQEKENRRNYYGKSRGDSEGLRKYLDRDNDYYERSPYGKRHKNDRYNYSNCSAYSCEHSPIRNRYYDRARGHSQSRAPKTSSSADRSSDASDVSKSSQKSQGAGTEGRSSTKELRPINDHRPLVGLPSPTATSPSTSQSSAAGPLPIVPVLDQNELNSDILQVIGTRIHPDRKFAPAVHTQVAAGVDEIIKKGLPAEKRQSLLEKFLSPQNCLMLDPPKLNPELKATLRESVIKRDSRIIEKQNTLAASLAGVLDVITKITKLRDDEKLPTKEVMESLWGILHLLADLQQEESNIRRSLVLTNIYASLKEALTATVVDEWLFGEKLEDKVKAAKTFESSSNILKSLNLQNQKNPHQSKNFKGPTRRPSAYRTIRTWASSGCNTYHKQKFHSGRRSTQERSGSSRERA